MKFLIKSIFVISILGVAMSSCGNPEDEIPVIDNNPLILSVDKPAIFANGKDEAHFTATQGGVDVTDKVSVCMADDDGVCLLHPVFTSSETGEFKFYAHFIEGTDNSQSNVVTVTAVKDEGFAAGKKLHKNVCFFTFTATWCAPCYTYKGVLHELMESYGDNIVAVNFYDAGSKPDVASDIFETFSAQLTQEGFDMNYIPTSFLDLDTYIEGDTTGEELETIYEAGVDVPSRVGIKVNSAVNGPYVNANIAVGAKEAGEYSIGVLLIEDNIVASQATDNSGYDDNYNHTNVFRLAASKDDIFGKELGSLEEGEVTSGDYRFTIASRFKSKNLSLVVYVTYLKDGKWTIANSVKAPVQGITDYKYDE